MAVAKIMSADEALSGMRGKLAAKGLPPGIIQAILDAIMGLFKSFCPALSPAPADLKALVKDGLDAYENDRTTRDRIVLRRHLRRTLGFFSRNLDSAEGACWAVGAETPEDEVAKYAAAWQANRGSLEDGE